MAGVALLVDDAAVLAAMGRAIAAGADRLALHEDLSAYLLTSTQLRFERETGPDGARWSRLSPRTAARRIGRRGGRRGYDNMLRVSGALYRSLDRQATEEEAIVGSNLKYARPHQLGAEIQIPERTATIYQHYDKKTDTFDPLFRKKKKSNFARDVTIPAHTLTIPARPYLGISAEDRDELVRIAHDHLRTAIGGVP